MTTKERLEHMLMDIGCSEKQAKAIMDIAIPKIEAVIPEYKITWDRPAREYPDMLHRLWFMEAKEVGLKWIDENCPRAWFREMFVQKQEAAS